MGHCSACFTPWLSIPSHQWLLLHPTAFPDAGRGGVPVTHGTRWRSSSSPPPHAGHTRGRRQQWCHRSTHSRQWTHKSRCRRCKHPGTAPGLPAKEATGGLGLQPRVRTLSLPKSGLGADKRTLPQWKEKSQGLPRRDWRARILGSHGVPHVHRETTREQHLSVGNSSFLSEIKTQRQS